ncbi:MAG: hypothetical protein ABSA11_04015 [Candidatus Bathyarchaeia archaeon]|jgi:hypothetical protein
MDVTIWLLIIIGILIGAFLYIKSDKRPDPSGEDELDDWDQQDQLEGDEI